MATLLLSLVACTPDVPTPDDGDITPPDNTPDPVTFSVTFDSKGGTGIEGYTGVEFGQTVPKPTTNPTKVGYIFDGWTLSNGDPVDFNQYTIYSNTTFFASWKPKTYTITAYLSDENRKDFILDITTATVSEYYGDALSIKDVNLERKDVDGVSVLATDFTLSFESTVTSTQSLPVPSTSKSGDRFMYWYYYEDGKIVPLTETLAQGSTKTSIALLKGYNYDGARTIYAMWYSAQDNITVEFVSANSNVTLAMDDVVIKNGDHIIKPTNPESSDYDFNKWTYIVKDNDDNDVIKDMSFYLDPTSHGTHITMDMTKDGVFTLYANWTRHINISSASDWTSLDTTNDEVKNANIYLVNDIKLDDYTTLFDGLNAFWGVFDGGNHTIEYAVSNANDTTGYMSFIGVNEGVVKGVNIYATAILETETDINKYILGSVVGENKGTVSGVVVKSYIVSAGSNEMDLYVGGIAGVNYGEISSSVVELSRMLITTQFGHIGGVVGHNVRGFVNDIQIGGLELDTRFTKDGYVGGVAGKITVGDCKKIVLSNGTMTVTSGASAYIGGIAGKIANNRVDDCTIADCRFVATGEYAYAGGVVGEGGSAIRNTSVADTSIEAVGAKIAVAGGVVGVNFCESGNRGQIQYVVAKGSVRGQSNGKVYVGGISGQQNAGASSSNGAVAYVYAEFDVYASTNSTASVKIGKAFGSLDKSTTCQNVFVADTSIISVDDVEYNADEKQYEITIHSAVQEITPGYETIQNATWVNKQLKLDSNLWIVADGSYPTLKSAS